MDANVAALVDGTRADVLALGVLPFNILRILGIPCPVPTGGTAWVPYSMEVVLSNTSSRIIDAVVAAASNDRLGMLQAAVLERTVIATGDDDDDNKPSPPYKISSVEGRRGRTIGDAYVRGTIPDASTQGASDSAP